MNDLPLGAQIKACKFNLIPSINQHQPQTAEVLSKLLREGNMFRFAVVVVCGLSVAGCQDRTINDLNGVHISTIDAPNSIKAVGAKAQVHVGCECRPWLKFAIPLSCGQIMSEQKASRCESDIPLPFLRAVM